MNDLKYKVTHFARDNNDKFPLKITRVSDTRWLSILAPVEKVVDQWDTLKFYYELVASNDHCQTAEYLAEHYSNMKNKIYLIYLKSILESFQEVNNGFQKQTADPLWLLTELLELLKKLSQRVTVPHRNFEPVESNIKEYFDCGASLGFECDNLIDLHLVGEEARDVRSPA